MASEEMRKKWGTIFMGDREASVEQLHAMQEPLLREKVKKEQTEDYMERVRARAADRAREILGAAYTERQKVLDEAKVEAAALKRHAAQECEKLKAEGEAARKMALAELAEAETERQNAEKIREAARGEGFQKGMDEAGVELHEFRAELGQAVSSVLRAIERQRKNILESWREELVELTQCAAQASSGYILKKEHQDILRSLVFQALDMLENRSIITVRVNPEDEASVSDMFRAARERFPELKQWVVIGDAQVEKGGLTAESGSGSVDLRRENFRAMVDGILSHLSLPGRDDDSHEAVAVRDIVEREVANIAALTPEPDQPEQPEEAPDTAGAGDIAAAGEQAEPDNAASAGEAGIAAASGSAAAAGSGANSAGQADNPASSDVAANGDAPAHLEEALAAVEPSGLEAVNATGESPEENPSYEELEEELFPLEEERPQALAAAPARQPEPAPAQRESWAKPEPGANQAADPKTLAEGGFL